MITCANRWLMFHFIRWNGIVYSMLSIKSKTISHKGKMHKKNSIFDVQPNCRSVRINKFRYDTVCKRLYSRPEQGLNQFGIFSVINRMQNEASKPNSNWVEITWILVVFMFENKNNHIIYQLPIVVSYIILNQFISFIDLPMQCKIFDKMQQTLDFQIGNVVLRNEQHLFKWFNNFTLRKWICV